MKEIVQNLYNLIAQTYDHAGAATVSAMDREIAQLVQRLVDLNELAPQIAVQIPDQIIVYVQEGRNPEIYTREFVEVIMKQNQKLKGKSEAFAQFRDILAREWAAAMPELKPQIRDVVHNTGGSLEI
ncbi:hypothetical protein, variant 2 [Verruconis gallopava]|nr:hypothetical protein, variant 2 [Verruconis gallopava]KIW06187.1 hypothetical protein, variant 2 [Verruconis gallopava]